MQKADVLRTVSGLFREAYEYLLNVMTGSEDFDERIRIEWAARKNPVYIPRLGFNIERDISKYVVFSKEIYERFRNRLEKTGKNPKQKEIKEIIKDYLDLKDGSTGLKRIQKELENKTYPEKLLFLPYESIFHTFYDYLTLKDLSEKGDLDEVLEFINSVENQHRELKGRDEHLKDFINRLKKEGIELSEEQKKVFEDSLDNTFVAFDGVPGSGKTTMLLFYFFVISKLLFKQKEGSVNIVLTANTYAAIKEFLRKVTNFSNKQELKNYLKEVAPINIHVFVSRERSKEFSEIGEKLEELVQEGILTFNINRKDGAFTDGINLILLPVSKFRGYFRPENRIQINASVDVLMVDEASQLSGPAIMEVLSGLSLNENSRIILVGDRSQLPPIFSVVEEELPFYSVGPLYNLYTLFKGKYKLCNLPETKRLPEEIVDVIEKLYTEIESKKDMKQSITLGEGFLKEALGVEDLSEFPLVRIKVIYPKDRLRYRRSNDVEVKIIKKILEEIQSNTDIRVAVMTPFTEQEELLKKEISCSKCIIGTVDKLQGREVPVGIISTVSNHPNYTKEVVSFICTPNRLNVALTRASEVTILVHSDTLQKEVEVSFDKDGIVRIKEILIGYKKFDREIPEDFTEILKDFPAINYELGFQMMKRVFSLTEKVKIIENFPESGMKIEIHTYSRRK